MSDFHSHPYYKLGRRPPKRAASISFSRFWTGQVPEHPLLADHLTKVSEWGLDKNDTYGDCGPTSVDNHRRLVTFGLTGTEESSALADVLDLYRRSGNPNFDPNDPGGPGDGGVDMQTMLEALLEGGIGGKKPLAFASVDHSNIDEVRAAIAIFGGVLFGVALEQDQQTQTDQGLWDYSPSNEWGGHAIVGGLYTSQAQGSDISVVTWAKVVGTTDAFCQHQLQECWVVIWPEHLGSKAFQDGIDLKALAADYESITGKKFPAVIPPNPNPDPGPKPGPKPSPALEQAFKDLGAAFGRIEQAAAEGVKEIESFLKSWRQAR